MVLFSASDINYYQKYVTDRADVSATGEATHDVVCLEQDAVLETGGHQHVTYIETRDPDGSTKRWSCVQVIAAIRDGERFAVAEDGRGLLTLLEPGLCPRCPFATLVVDPPGIRPISCA